MAKDYLAERLGLGANGLRFDAAIHIEPGFYPDVLMDCRNLALPSSHAELTKVTSTISSGFSSVRRPLMVS